MLSNLASVPNSWTPGQQPEQFTLFCPTSVDDNFLNRSFCTEKADKRPLGWLVPNPEELTASDPWGN